MSSISIRGLAEPIDSLVKKYDKEDPRNPRCPCHKYQRRAEKEFEKEREQKNKKVERIKTQHILSEKSKRLIVRKHFFKANKRYEPHSSLRAGNKKFFRRKKSPDACSTWK